MVASVAKLLRDVTARDAPLRDDCLIGVAEVVLDPPCPVPVTGHIALRAMIKLIDHAPLVDRQPIRIGGEKAGVVPHIEFPLVVSGRWPSFGVAERWMGRDHLC